MTEPEPCQASGAWPRQPLAGVSLHFSSLPSPLGIGDIADAALGFVDQLAEMKLRVWQVLPTGPTGYGDSPYQSLSTFAGNEMLVGLEPLLREGLLRNEELQPLGELPAGTVDFPTLIPLKRNLLRRAAERFLSPAGSGPGVAYESFLERCDSAWLHDYALYRVLKTLHGERAWPRWEDDLARRDRDALQEVGRKHGDAIARIKAIQFFFDRQWQGLRDRAAEKGIRLFGDIPFYIALDSSDAWAGMELLQMKSDARPSHVAGVPPDYFSADGQLWGNPLYDWEYHAATDFEWWTRRLAEAARRCDMVRVDHFRGFESYWSIPAGENTARKGEWMPGPGDALFKAVTRALGELPIVAEDLGIITEKVEQLRRRHRIPGMKVLHFELADPEFDPSNIAEDCVCYTATHDNNTTIGWFEEKGGSRNGDTRTRKEARRTRRNALRLTGGKADTIHRDIVSLALSTRARVAMAPMQDYLGLGAEARLNVPGTSDGNWRWRMLKEQLSDDRKEEIARLVEDRRRA